MKLGAVLGAGAALVVAVVALRVLHDAIQQERPGWPVVMVVLASVAVAAAAAVGLAVGVLVRP